MFLMFGHIFNLVLKFFFFGFNDVLIVCSGSQICTYC